VCKERRHSCSQFGFWKMHIGTYLEIRSWKFSCLSAFRYWLLLNPTGIQESKEGGHFLSPGNLGHGLATVGPPKLMSRGRWQGLPDDRNVGPPYSPDPPGVREGAPGSAGILPAPACPAEAQGA
jgi:hypothetical protein